jgi:hypothetical protein
VVFGLATLTLWSLLPRTVVVKTVAPAIRITTDAAISSGTRLDLRRGGSWLISVMIRRSAARRTCSGSSRSGRSNGSLIEALLGHAT